MNLLQQKMQENIENNKKGTLLLFRPEHQKS